MSYCRFIKGEVYLYPDTGGFINCCWCYLQDKSVHLNSYEEAIEHIEEHKEAGHNFPYNRVKERLEKERDGEIDLPYDVFESCEEE